MARKDPTIYMRIPQELKEKLDAASEENRRSMTAEVVARLQASFDGVALDGESAPGLTQTVRELESLQRLGSLTYLLQRATFKTDAARIQVNQAWRALQDAIQSGTPEERAKAKSDYTALNEELQHYVAEVETVEKQISLVHEERKLSGLKELRDVRPVYASVRGIWTDTGLVADKGRAAKSPKSNS